MRLLPTRIGRDGDDPSPPAPDKLAQHRIAAARHCRNWTEIDADKLVRRDRGWYVDSESDHAYKAYGGDAFSPSAEIVADQTPLFFFIVDDDVHMLLKDPDTWSEITRQRARAGAR